MTRRGNDTRLYLDGGLQFSTRDEYRYTESLVYPALGDGAHSVLVLGGGDGLAARELLRQPGVERIVQVELDSAVIELARTTLREANGGSLDNPRVNVVIGDAMTLATRAPKTSCGGSTRSSSTFPTPTPPCWAGCIRPSSTRWSPRAGPRRADGGAGRQPVFDADGVLAHGLDDPGRRVCRHAVPRARADVRRLGIRPGAPRRHRRPHRPCRPTPRRCASSTSGCSTPPRCSPATSGPARSNPRPWTTRASSRTCATATTSQPPRRGRPAPRRTGRRWSRRSARRRCPPARRRA